jgi:glycosyltransferase involved in cell wall biosynthesis
MGASSGRPADGTTRVVVVGAGTRLLSGMSYYTIRLTNALAALYPVAAIPMRQLMPSFLYPGRSRIGTATTRLHYDPGVTVLKGVDWYWAPNIFGDLIDLVKWRPDIVIFEWWTGTVLHTYLAIALLARLRGASVIVEFHEILDTGEERLLLARTYVKLIGRLFFRLAAAFVIHSDSDREPLERRYRLGTRPCVVIPLGPFDHHVSRELAEGSASVVRAAPPDTLNLLYFGIIRPFKGLEDLIEAFETLDNEAVKHYWLTVVGETWEGWDEPIRRIASSPHRARITLVNRFVDDGEITAHFAGADAVVLPYRRSSASGPAHIAMSSGLPLVITAVGGLPAAVAHYEGAILVPPGDPAALQNALRRLPELVGRRYPDPHSWDRTVERYAELMRQLGNGGDRVR